MPANNYPFSGAVQQAFKMWSSMFDAVGSQIGLININVGASSNPDVEEQVVSNVASYGRQLGRINDVMTILLAKLDMTDLDEDQRRAVADLKSMLNGIADVKQRKGLHVLRPSMKDGPA
jgi:hypothetical protein